MKALGLHLGPLTVWLWAGSWAPWGEWNLDCGCCWNFYLGPFGIEWGERP